MTKVIETNAIGGKWSYVWACEVAVWCERHDWCKRTVIVETLNKTGFAIQVIMANEPEQDDEYFGGHCEPDYVGLDGEVIFTSFRTLEIWAGY
jgi:hypothetical protein